MYNFVIASWARSVAFVETMMGKSAMNSSLGQAKKSRILCPLETAGVSLLAVQKQRK